MRKRRFGSTRARGSCFGSTRAVSEEIAEENCRFFNFWRHAILKKKKKKILLKIWNFFQLKEKTFISIIKHDIFLKMKKKINS